MISPANVSFRPEPTATATFGNRQAFQPAVGDSRPETVHFGATGYRGFANKDIKAMRQMLAQATYVKDFDLLTQSDAFQAQWDGETVRLKNFRLPTAGGKHDYLGVCDDLPRHLKPVLEKELGDKYVFELVTGRDTEYFKGWEHYFLLAWPKDADSRVQGELANLPEKIPQGVLVLDPSTQILGQPGRDLHSYSLKREGADISPDDTFSLKDRTVSGGTSIGYLENLDPTYQDEPMRAVAALYFFKDENGGPPEAVIGISQKDRKLRVWDKWQDYPADHPLVKFMHKVQAGLNASSPTGA